MDKCSHPQVLVELHVGWAWQRYDNSGQRLPNQFWRNADGVRTDFPGSGIDPRQNLRVFVWCQYCRIMWRCTENSLRRAPRWVREPGQRAVDEWWANYETAPTSFGGDWAKR